MIPRRFQRLFSLPFLTLYAVAAGAVVLNQGRGRWAERRWFSFAVGFVAAGGIIVLTSMLWAFLERGRGTQRWRSVGFLSIAAVLCLTGFVYFVSVERWLAVCSLMFAVIFGWAALGTCYEWPGFREPRNPDDCPNCTYDRLGRLLAECPACAAAWREEDAGRDDT
jgi:hypothetical protein